MSGGGTHRTRAVDIEGFGHQNPIPAASRLGPLLVSSMVVGYDPGTSTVPQLWSAQVANLFAHVGSILTAGDAAWSDIVRMTFYVPSLDVRPDINVAWLEHFPDAEHRPARITHEVRSELGIRCEFLAYVVDGTS